MKHLTFSLLFFIGITYTLPGYGQSFYFGSDLSYVNEMEDCGAVYKVNSTPEDPYQIFQEHGTNLVRLRLWHSPSWYDALNQGHRYSDFQDVRKSIMRAKAEGMQVLLDFHLSDTWADPGHQVIPASWAPVVDSLEILKDSLYNYIFSTLNSLAIDNLLPELVQIGNETNKGILVSQATNDGGFTLSWPRNAALFNTAIKAVRDVEVAHSTHIKIALHIADPANAGWLMEGFWSHGVRDFDIIGLSYYWQYHMATLNDVGNTITSLKSVYPGKEVMILETGYPWTTSNADGANNLLFNSYPGYSPATTEHQKQWLINLAQVVIDHGGKGIVYWEPAWVSTGCNTQYGKGSNWDNATFFDHNDSVQEDGGIAWMNQLYDYTLGTLDEQASPFHVNVYRAGNEIVLQTEHPERFNTTLKIELMSVDGKNISLSQIQPDWKENELRITIPHLVPGCYVVTGMTESNFIFSKLIFIK